MNKQKEGFNRIVLAVDGSDSSKKAAEKAFYLSKKTDIELVALYVVYIPASAYPPTPTVNMGDVSNVLKKNGELILDDIVGMASKFNLKIKKKMLNGIPDDEIIKFANRDDLIIMGSKGHSTLGRILIGSISEKVLHHSEAAVMIVR
jgi:nucleotide-binding universal stress UspA family protein